MPSARMPPEKLACAAAQAALASSPYHQHYAFDGPCSGCSGRLDNADDVSEIMQRSPVGSRFAVSFCCFNKNENLYGGEEMLYAKV